MEITEAVGEAIIQKNGHLFALLIGETGIAAVGLRIFDIYLFVCYIQIAADDDWFLGIKRFQKLAEIVFPSHAIIQALEFCLRIWGVAGNEIELVIFQRDDSAFMIMFLYAHAIAYAQRLVLGINGCTRVSFFLSVVPITLVALKQKVELSLLHLCFLQAEEVGIEFLKLVLEVLAYASAQAIYIP